MTNILKISLLIFSYIVTFLDYQRHFIRIVTSKEIYVYYAKLLKCQERLCTYNMHVFILLYPFNLRKFAFLGVFFNWHLIKVDMLLIHPKSKIMAYFMTINCYFVSTSYAYPNAVWELVKFEYQGWRKFILFLIIRFQK